MKTSEFENFFFYLTDKSRALKGKEITPELKSTWELVFAPVAFQDAIAAVNYWIGNETFTPTQVGFGQSLQGSLVPSDCQPAGSVGFHASSFPGVHV